MVSDQLLLQSLIFARQKSQAWSLDYIANERGGRAKTLESERR
jgi:hypothetical protein